MNRNYWLARVNDDWYLGEAIRNQFYLAQFRYDANNQLNMVSIFLKAASKVREGDVLFLTCNGKIYAYGFAVECPYESNQICDLEEVISKKHHKFNSGIVRFHNIDVFYENLEEGCGSYGQRINVDKWHYYSNPASVSNSGINYKGGTKRDTLRNIEDADGERLMASLRNEYFKKYKGMDIQKIYELLKGKKNIILQGAPGTGKTYNTAAIALSILGESDVDLSDHKAVMERYKSLQDDKRIFFTTFHQSLDYEDFVEGLKPNIEKDEGTGKFIGITYEVKDGIFKQACEATHFDANRNDIKKCIDDYIKKIEGVENKREIPTITGGSNINVWWNNGNTTINFRSVRSGSKSDSPAAVKIEDIKKQALNGADSNDEYCYHEYANAFIKAAKNDFRKPVVLIIDEINRGNVSKIFGELITLIEADKRQGGDHPIEALLPYSKDKFIMPSELYIIGTMNTTDRSTGTLDYALRRRFDFVTMKSDIEIVKEHYTDVSLRDKVVALFENIKVFIEKHSSGDYEIEDLMVGHSYFMAKDEGELKDKMKYEVIPLIKEYMNDGILNVDKKKVNEIIKEWCELKTSNI